MQESFKEEQFFPLLYALIPAIAFPNFAYLFPSFSPILVSGALGAIGAITGYMLFLIFKPHSRSVKIFVLVMFVVAIILGLELL